MNVLRSGATALVATCFTTLLAADAAYAVQRPDMSAVNRAVARSHKNTPCINGCLSDLSQCLNESDREYRTCLRDCRNERMEASRSCAIGRLINGQSTLENCLQKIQAFRACVVPCEGAADISQQACVDGSLSCLNGCIGNPNPTATRTAGVSTPTSAPATPTPTAVAATGAPTETVPPAVTDTPAATATASASPTAPQLTATETTARTDRLAPCPDRGDIPPARIFLSTHVDRAGCRDKIFVTGGTAPRAMTESMSFACSHSGRTRWPWRSSSRRNAGRWNRRWSPSSGCSRMSCATR